MIKYGLTSLFLLTVLFAGMVSCSNNKDLEKRIAELENQLDNQKSSGSSTVPTPAPAPAQAQPEVKPDGPLPVFEFTKTEHDFGTLKDGDVVKHTFTFKNTGEAPLIIQSARGSCGCTVPSWPQEPIPVGGTGEITAEYNSKGQSGIQNKNITITANTWPKTSTLKIKAEVQN